MVVSKRGHHPYFHNICFMYCYKPMNVVTLSSKGTLTDKLYKKTSIVTFN